MKKDFEVRFTTRLGGDRNWTVYVRARNPADARRVAKSVWRDRAERLVYHMFNIKAYAVEPGEEIAYDLFREVSSDGKIL